MSCSHRLGTMMSLLVTLMLTSCLCFSAARNCNWKNNQALFSTFSSVNTEKVVIQTPDTIENGTTCETRLSTSLNSDDWVRIIIDFNFAGPRECDAISESLTLIIGYKIIKFCGNVKPLFLVVKVDVIRITYSPGSLSKPRGFKATFTIQTIQCYGYYEYKATETPQLLYSYGYPYKYPRYFRCRADIKAPLADHLIHIRSIMMDLNDSEGCSNGYISFDDTKFCGTEHFSWWSQSSAVTMRMDMGSAPPQMGYQLEVTAVRRSRVQCSNNTVHSFEATDKLNLYELTFADGTLRENPTFVNDSCTVTIDSGSDDHIVLLNLRERQDGLTCEEFKVEVIMDNDIEPAFESCGSQNPFYFLHSRGREVTLKFTVMTMSFILHSVQQPSFTAVALSKDQLQDFMEASKTPSYVWVSHEMKRSSSKSRLSLIESASNHIKVSVWNASTDINLVDLVRVFNGDNSSCFQLTADCNGEPRLEASVYSSMTETVTIEANENSHSGLGNWIEFKDTEDFILPVSRANSSERLLQFKQGGKVNMRNMMCRWAILLPQKDFDWVKIKTFTDLPAPNSLDVNAIPDSKSVRGKYLGSFAGSGLGNKWMYFNSSIEITLKVPAARRMIFFNIVTEMKTNDDRDFSTTCQPRYLVASYNYMDAATINHPNFLPMNLSCSWFITKKSDLLGFITITFKEFLESYCEFKDFLISSANLRGGLERACLQFSSERKSIMFPTDVEIVLHSGSTMHPGFRFLYKLQSPAYLSQCNRTRQLVLGETWQISTDFNPGEYFGTVVCTFLVTASDDMDVVKLTIKNVNLMSSKYVTCGHQVNELSIYSGPSDNYNLLKRVCHSDKDRPDTQVYSEDKDMFIKVTIRIPSTVRLRFSVSVTASQVEGCDGPMRIIEASEGSSYRIVSPGYPTAYPINLQCAWSITTDWNKRIEITIAEMNIGFDDGCDNDYLQIFDSAGGVIKAPLSQKLCGVVNHVVYYSSDYSVRITFDSDAKENSGSFSIIVKAVRDVGQKPGTEWHEVMRGENGISANRTSGNTVLPIVLGITAGVVIILLLIVCIFCRTRRQRQRQHNIQGSTSVMADRPQSQPEYTMETIPSAPPIESAYSSTYGPTNRPGGNRDENAQEGASSPQSNTSLRPLIEPPPYDEVASHGPGNRSPAAQTARYTDGNRASNQFAPGNVEEDPPPQYDFAVAHLMDKGSQNAQV